MLRVLVFIAPAVLRRGAVRGLSTDVAACRQPRNCVSRQWHKIALSDFPNVHARTVSYGLRLMQRCAESRGTIPHVPCMLA